MTMPPGDLDGIKRELYNVRITAMRAEGSAAAQIRNLARLSERLVTHVETLEQCLLALGLRQDEVERTAG